MRKALALTLAAAMALSLAACTGSTTSESSSAAADSSSSADTSETGDGSEAASTSSGDFDVTVLYYAYSDTYISSVRTALDADLTAAGITYTDYDSNNSQTTQNEYIDTAIANGTDLLIVNMVTSGSSDTANSICDKAEAAGIPVIFFNRAVEEDDNAGAVLGTRSNIAFVGTDAPEAGHMQGEMIGNYLIENYDAVDLNGDGEISYAMFMGDASNVEAIYRTQYSVEDANAILTENGYPELVYFDSTNENKYQLDMTGAWSAQAAMEYMQTNLASYSEANGNMIELIICNNDNMAEGCITALQAAGYNNGEGTTTIPVFGVDATDSAQQLIANGTMTGTIKQDAEGMAECIALLATNVMNGEDLLANTDSYTKDTANSLDNKIFIPYQEYTG
ncbi:MAG TPA: galactose ABC transporter substrate-binding protein [Candidatus Gemmiger stercorigallinarum]|nr:galactose ABC transporter substrate-binding protein [Candidatus Gemmiger stercorigallinarum]